MLERSVCRVCLIGFVVPLSSMAAALVCAADDPPPDNYTVTTSDDLDGDDEMDVVIALPAGHSGTGQEAGLLRVMSSSSGTVTLTGRKGGDWFGASAAIAGRLNSDNYDDLIVGAPRELDGRAYVFYGPFRSYVNPNLNVADADFEFYSPDAEDYDFGEQVGAVSDVSGDGIPDLRIRAWHVDASGTGEEPRTYVLSGASGSPLFTIEGDSPFDPWQEMSGDTNGDGDVDQADLNLVVHNNGRTGASLKPSDGDVNWDHVVNSADAALVQTNMGTNLFIGFHAGGSLPGNAFTENRSFHVTAGGPHGDDDGDGIPNINDPDSSLYDPWHRCSRPVSDCDGDGVANFRDPDWWFYYFRGDDPEVDLPDDPNQSPAIGFNPFDPPAQNQPISIGWIKSDPYSDPDLDGIPNYMDRDDDGDGIPDNVDPQPWTPCNAPPGHCSGPPQPPIPPTPPPPPPPQPPPGGGTPPGCQAEIRPNGSWNYDWLPKYIDFNTPGFGLYATTNWPVCSWSWSATGVASIMVQSLDAATIHVNGTGTGSVTATCNCHDRWDFKAVDLEVSLDAAVDPNPPPGSFTWKALWVNSDDDDNDGVSDLSDPDVAGVQDAELRSITLGGLVGANATEFQNRRWCIASGSYVKVWYKVGDGDILADAWPAAISPPETRVINGSTYGRLPSNQWINGSPPVGHVVYVEAVTALLSGTSMYYGFSGDYTHPDSGVLVPANFWKPIWYTAKSLSLEFYKEKGWGLGTNLDACPVNGGKRVFPGRVHYDLPADDPGNNRVYIYTTLATPKVGVPIYVRIFDVDDPSSSSLPVDPNDAAGPTGNDNRESWPNGYMDLSSSTTAGVQGLSAPGTAVVQFFVSMHPGDNYKAFVTASQADRDSITQTMADGGAPLPNGVYASPMLTVWRKLFIEQDSMQSPTAAQITFTSTTNPTSVTPNAPVAGQATINLGINLPDDFSDQDLYEGGTITCGGCGTSFPIWSNTSNPFSNDQVVIVTPGGSPGNCVTSGTFTLKDDDVASVLPHYPDWGDVGVVVFNQAYVELQAVEVQYRDIVPFELNLSDVQFVDGLNWNDGQDIASAPDYWCQLVVGCWQGEQNEDFDADTTCHIPPFLAAPAGAEYTPTLGVTRSSSWNGVVGSAIYMEVLRDYAVAFGVPEENRTVAHEIAHGCGLSTHVPSTIMAEGAEGSYTDLPPEYIAKIRDSITYGP